MHLILIPRLTRHHASCVCAPIADAIVTGANQEHGIIVVPNSADVVTDFPVGTLLRILPNHACATAAQFSSYHIVSSGGSQNVTATWDVYGGW